MKGRRGHGRDHMVVRFATTCAIGAYHHWCEFESRSERGVLNTTLCDKVTHYYTMRLSIILHPLLMIFSVITGHSLTAVSSPAEKTYLSPFYYHEKIFSLLFNRFQLFSSEKNSESCRTLSEQVKNRPFERGCRWFQLFFIDFQLFYFLTRIIPILYLACG